MQPHAYMEGSVNHQSSTMAEQVVPAVFLQSEHHNLSHHHESIPRRFSRVIWRSSEEKVTKWSHLHGTVSILFYTGKQPNSSHHFETLSTLLLRGIKQITEKRHYCSPHFVLGSDTTITGTKKETGEGYHSDAVSILLFWVIWRSPEKVTHWSHHIKQCPFVLSHDRVNHRSK